LYPRNRRPHTSTAICKPPWDVCGCLTPYVSRCLYNTGEGRQVVTHGVGRPRGSAAMDRIGTMNIDTKPVSRSCERTIMRTSKPWVSRAHSMPRRRMLANQWGDGQARTCDSQPKEYHRWPTVLIEWYSTHSATCTGTLLPPSAITSPDRTCMYARVWVYHCSVCYGQRTRCQQSTDGVST
jgi:hypothetical protein